MTEASGITGDDFSMNICKQWEAAFFNKVNPQTRKVALRTSIVLGNEGGAFPKFKQITRLGLGGEQGRGAQMMSWVHIDDFCAAVAFIMAQEQISGPVNITAPVPVPNLQFMQQLRKRCRMSFGLPAPVYILEIAAVLLGTETELMLKSRNAVPARLLQEGFTFQYPAIDLALAQLIP
ncbi:Epimerase family protein [compost metagenome]